MEEKRQVSTYWLPKAIFCAALLAFWTAKCDAQLGTPPIIAVQPLGCIVPKGGTLCISATAVSPTPMGFSWTLNGHSLTGVWVSNYVDALVGTVSTLIINNASASDNGSYSMSVSNAVGSVTSCSANVVVLGTITPLTLSVVSNSPASGFGLQLSGPVGSNMVLEASSDLKSWSPIYTNKSGSGTASYTDKTATNYPSRFYRTRLQ